MAIAGTVVWLGMIAACAAVLWLAYTELTYLGRPLTRWLYGRAAGTYEAKWRSGPYSSPEVTRTLFMEPLRQALAGKSNARLLDLACGSGRVSRMVYGESWFLGCIDAIDLSPDMIRRFGEALPSERVTTTVGDLAAWQAPATARYDAVAFMEASELLPDFPRLVAEVARALAPGGLFLLTKVHASQAWLFIGRHQSARAMTRLLNQHGLQRVEILPWRRRYDVVHAWKG